MGKKVVIIVEIVFITLTSFVFGCQQKAETNNRNLNLFIDIKDSNSGDSMHKIIEEFQKKYPDIKIENINTFGAKGENSIIEGINGAKKIDILVTSRNEMIKLSQKGLLSDMSKIYEKEKINDNYYSCITNYGRYGDKYFGIGFLPYVMEIVYNKTALKKMNLKAPLTLKNCKPIFKYMVTNNVKIPYITTDDMDINDIIYSFIGSNTIDLSAIEKIYDSKADSYKKIKDMQKVFDTLNSLQKDGLINSNLFEKGSNSDINSLNLGNIPLMITISNFNNKLEGDCDIVNDYSIFNGAKEAVPVIVDSLICVPTSSKNSSEVNDFLKFIYSMETQKKLVKGGILTGNVKANDYLTGINIEASKLLKLSDLDNMLLFYNLPDKIRNGINAKTSTILKGKFTGNEWNEIFEG